MSTFDRNIIAILDPTIKVEPLMISDLGSKTAVDNTTPADAVGLLSDNSVIIGARYPYVVINRTICYHDQILYFDANFETNIPKLNITVKDHSNMFGLDFPSDGDVISLYLRPPDIDNLRPIRIDFDILQISSHPKTSIYSFSGIMKVPGLFAEQSIAFKKDTTFNQLKEVCTSVGLGFASNETMTDDIMTRICPFDTLETFISDTVKSSYKDDKSFFDWYIDPYYYLCLVNVNKQFTIEDNLEIVNMSKDFPAGSIPDQTDNIDSRESAMLLTNSPDRLGYNMFINDYSLESLVGNTWINNGYKRYAQYYNILTDNSEYVSHYVDPLTTDDTKDIFVLSKGKAFDDFYKKQNKYKWLGKQNMEIDSSNVHPNYMFAKILNFQNLQEIQKLSLNIQLSSMNLYITKYMNIPVAIYEHSRDSNNIRKLKNRDIQLGENDDNNKNTSLSRDGETDTFDFGEDTRDYYLNSFLSGNYLVAGYKYTYSYPGPIQMSIRAIRRDWPIPTSNDHIL